MEFAVMTSGRSRVARRFLLRVESSGWFRHWVVCARCVNLYSTESSGWSRHRVVFARSEDLLYVICRER